MRDSRYLRRVLPAAFLVGTAAAMFVALGGVGSTVWGYGIKSRRPFIPVAALPLPDFVLRFYGDTTGQGTPPTLNQPSVVIAEHTLTFHAGDPDELANVMLAVNNVNGAWIMPGETFSFNAIVGERTQERGFRAGLMYVSGRLVSGIGGGVCIPSTALYNAALKAGLEIVERYNHSGPVRYAEPGLDAAVAYGYKDFRFRNNTDGPLTIRAAVDGETLKVTLLARRPTGHRVIIETTDTVRLAFDEETVLDPETPEGQPVVEQEGRAGFTVTVIRTILQGDKVLRRETVSRDVVGARARITRMNPLDDPESPEALARLAETEKAEELLKPTDVPAAQTAPVAAPPTPAVERETPKAPITNLPATPKEYREPAKPAPGAGAEAKTPKKEETKPVPAPNTAEPPHHAAPTPPMAPDTEAPASVETPPTS